MRRIEEDHTVIHDPTLTHTCSPAVSLACNMASDGSKIQLWEAGSVDDEEGAGDEGPCGSRRADRHGSTPAVEGEQQGYTRLTGGDCQRLMRASNGLAALC